MKRSVSIGILLLAAAGQLDAQAGGAARGAGGPRGADALVESELLVGPRAGGFGGSVSSRGHPRHCGVYGKVDSGPNPRYGVFSEGNFGGTGAKFFVQPHPTDARQEIRYVCLEGPEAGTYFRGTAALSAGSAVISVPESFGMVTELEGLSVQLTAIGAPALLWVESQDLRTIVVRGEPDVRFHYLVNGVRLGYGGLEPLQANAAFVPRVRGLPFGGSLLPEQRRLLVDNGTLNADFTPNEATAARLGWVLRDPTPDELAAAGR